MSSEFYPLRISEICNELVSSDDDQIANAKTFLFDVPESLQHLFTWRAGQHITVQLPIGDATVRRAYSISMSPLANRDVDTENPTFSITVKRVADGMVSNYLLDNMKTGDTIEIMPPFGDFCLDPQLNSRRSHYFFAAGSGITPLFAMLQSVLIAEPHSVVYLLYGNSDVNNVIFQQQLFALAEQYSQRLVIRHIFSRPSVWASDYWRKGRVDSKSTQAFINEHPPYAQDAQYYICGPDAMNASVTNGLLAIDVPRARIHQESYGTVSPLDDSVVSVAAKLTVTLHGSRHEVTVSKNQTLLAAMKAANIKPPFSCQSGICGACKAQLTQGTTHMVSHAALQDNDVAEGKVLTCQALATASYIELIYP